MRRAGLERMMLLGAFPALAHMPPAHLAAMAALCEENFYPAGSEIIAEAQPVRLFHYVIEGEVELRRAGRPLRRFGPRSVLGGLSALAGVTGGPQAIAVADTTTFSFTQENQLDVFEDNFELLVSVIRAVAGDYVDARQMAGERAGFAEDPEGRPASRGALDLVEKIALLRRSVPFAEAALESLVELARESPEKWFAAGEVIWRTGERSGHGLLIAGGAIEGRSGDGRQRFRFSRGSVVGGLDSLAGRPRWFDATAVAETATLVVPTAALLDLFEDHVDLAVDLLRALARGVLALREQIAAGAPEGA